MDTGLEHYPAGRRIAQLFPWADNAVIDEDHRSHEDCHPMPRRFQFSLRRLLVAVGVVALPLWYVSGYMRGTLYFDENGFPHGTGTQRYFYPSGALKLDEYYRGGLLARSRWYRPDGSFFAETKWGTGTSVGYYLRDDGSVLAKYEYVRHQFDGKPEYLAEGRTVYYDEHGSVERTAMFHEGKEVKP